MQKISVQFGVGGEPADGASWPVQIRHLVGGRICRPDLCRIEKWLTSPRRDCFDALPSRIGKPWPNYTTRWLARSFLPRSGSYPTLTRRKKPSRMYLCKFGTRQGL